MSVPELACSYAAVILEDDGIPVTADKIAELVKAANIKIDSYWAPLFAKLFEKRSVNDLISSVGTGGGGGGAVAAAPAAAAAAEPAAVAAVEEKKKEEVKEESEDEDMGFSLFD